MENKRRFIRRGADLEADAFGVNHEDEPVQEEGEDDSRPSDAFVVQGDHGEDGVGGEVSQDTSPMSLLCLTTITDTDTSD